MTAPHRLVGAADAPRMHAALVAEVVRGLTAPVKTLPPKLLYDARGSELFERICELPEYYLTRAELAILRTHAAEIAAAVGPGCALVEYGSGAGVKVQLLLDALDAPAAYVAVDISAAQLAAVTADIARRYPALAVRAVWADYTREIRLPALPPGARRVAFFPGSTIGNFHPGEAAAFLARLRRTVGPGGAVLLGVDRAKSAATLHAAYDDAAGVTAAFDLNLLHRLNREFGGTFDVAAFRHRAVVNEAASRVEMHLECTRDATFTVAGHAVPFTRGETIWTESSYKYDAGRLDTLVDAAGLRVVHRWSDPADAFRVVLLEPTAA